MKFYSLNQYAIEVFTLFIALYDRQDNMNDIMEIQINGPSLEDYCPDSAIAHWYDKSNGKRHVDGHKLSSN